jgi:glyoxylase-like metal-dependent hydrolase (beta-lactamase superfamily II)
MRLLRSMILAAGILTAAAGVAATTGPIAVEPAATKFNIGKLTAFALHDADFAAANDGSVFGVDGKTEEVTKVLKAAGASPDVVALSVNVLLVKDKGHAILLDTGLGPKAHGVLMQSLKKAGMSAGDITDVLITHVHGDHVGGLATADGMPAFPKATVRMSNAEWVFMQSQSDLAPLVKTISAQVQTFEPGTLVAPGITAVAIKGHTPGHIGYEIVNGDDRILDIGDSAHSSIVSLVRPDWTMGFDSDRAVAKASREALLSDLSKSHEKIFSPHFPYPGVGTIESEGIHFRWQPTLKSGK